MKKKSILFESKKFVKKSIDKLSKKIFRGFEPDANKVILKEKRYIKQNIDAHGKNPDIWYGLALSGGGIRSASFGCGVLQAMVNHDELKKIDYISTVSGGGYIGSSLSWFLNQGLPDGKSAGTRVENFPFGQKGAGGCIDPKPNAILDYIRQHCNYLLPGQGLNIISLFGTAIRTIFISLFVYLSLLTLSLIYCVKLNIFRLIPDALPKIPSIDPWIRFIDQYSLNTPLLLAVFLIICILLSALWFSIRTRLFRWNKTHRYKGLIFGQKILGHAWTIVMLLLLLGSIPLTMHLLQETWQKITACVMSSLIGIVTGLIRFKNEQTSKSSDRKRSQWMIITGAFLLVYGLLIAAYMISLRLSHSSWTVLFILTAVSLFFAFCVNLNNVGPHRIYRNRLMETFMPNKDNVIKNQWGAATSADTALFSNMCHKKNRRPFHLINTNIVLVDSMVSKYRDRGGDSFILSPLYSGSDATGYRKTSDFRERLTRGMTLATAMAVSAAAANPHTGAGGKGVTRNRIVSTLMSLLNLRLGYWTLHPKTIQWTPFVPNFIVPGLKGGLFGRGLQENHWYIQLTDGGHFENLGLYELIRRQLDVIIVADAVDDLNFNFGDLGNCIERVRVDFGAIIRFEEDPSMNMEGLLPGSASDNHLTKKYNLSRRGYAIANIRYHDGSAGKLIYIKTTLTESLPVDVYSYKSRHPDFPDQSTADQFFDESQFEAYRELGYQLTSHMLSVNKTLSRPWIP